MKCPKIVPFSTHFKFISMIKISFAFNPFQSKIESKSFICFRFKSFQVILVKYKISCKIKYKTVGKWNTLKNYLH